MGCDNGQRAATIESKMVPNASEIACLAISPDGRTVVTPGSDNDLDVWSLKNGKRLCQLKGHSGRILALAFSPDGRMLASSGTNDQRNEPIFLWETASWRERLRLKAKNVEDRAVCFSPDGKLLAGAATMDGGVRFWDTATGEDLGSLG